MDLLVCTSRPLVVENDHDELPPLLTLVPVVQQPFCLFGQVYPDGCELQFHLRKQFEMLLWLLQFHVIYRLSAV